VIVVVCLEVAREGALPPVETSGCRGDSLGSPAMSDEAGEEPDFDYRLTLTEILAMRDTVQGWQQAGSPNGLPVDLAADRALSDAVQHLSAAAAALDSMSGLTSPPATGTTQPEGGSS